MFDQRILATMVLLLSISCSLARGASNLVENGVMESVSPEDLPVGWEALVIGAPAKLSSDSEQKHGGQTSIRLDATEVTRSYARTSKPIEVAPGETIRGSAWVKVEDVPAGQGTVIMIAEFSDGEGEHESVEKFNVANVAEKEWQKIQGSVKVPANARQLRLRLGFSYSHGTCWWDDVEIESASAIAVRTEIPGGHLTPGLQNIPLRIFNRDGRKGNVTPTIALNGRTFIWNVPLSGKPVEQVQMPIASPSPGKATMTLKLIEQVPEQTVLFEPPPWNGVVPQPLVLYPPSPTHWVVEDGKPKIEYRFDAFLPAEDFQGTTILFELHDATGRSIAQWVGKSLAHGSNTGEYDLQKLPPGQYTVVLNIHPRNKKPMVAKHPWHVIERAKAKVTLNDAGFPVADGKAIFPMGIFNGAKFKEQADAGFTVTHAYNAVRLEEQPRNGDFNALRFIDNTHANGMKMLFMIPMKTAIKGDYDAVRRRVRMFRNHPGLLAWDEEEGFARGDFKPDTLKKVRQIINEEDPHHPFMVGDARDVIGRVRGKPDFFPDGEMDLGMWWWYPFPLKQRPGDALQGEDGNESAAKWDVLTPPYFLTSSTKKPLWVGIQSYKKPGADARYPTPAEYRAQAYLAIASGAKGLMWYGGSVTGGLFLNPEEGHWDELKKLVRELRDNEEVWLSPTDAPPPYKPADAPLAVCVKKSAKGRVLIAVNRGPKPIEVTVEGYRPFELGAYGVKVTSE